MRRHSFRTWARLWLLTFVSFSPGAVFAQEQERPPLPDYLASSIPDAIDRGKKFLQRSQTNTGTWAAKGEGNVVGLAALPALALLECGVPATDKSIQAAAYFIRKSVDSKELTNTYEVSLALLFLDRLISASGDAKGKAYVTDKGHIETLAARLIASQTPTGGWGYQTQYLSKADSDKVLTNIKRLKKEPLPLDYLLAGRVPQMYNPFVKKEPVSDAELKPKRLVKLPKEYELLPCFTQFGTFPLVDPKENGKLPPFLQHTDNSTTQFGLLALWAARRHGIPCERTGAMAFLRYHTSQNPDGSWGYEYALGGTGGTATMINTGLLGMAVGHGLVREMGLKDDPPVDEDPRILQGFKAVGAHVGLPADKIKDLPLPNLYFLWGLERVCLIFNVHTVGNKDWYRWAAEALVANQDPEAGNWASPKEGSYPGATPIIDTAFALMVLKRANLANDLSAYLAFSPKKLNEGVVKLMPVAAAPQPEPKPEPPKVTETKPEPKPEPPKAAETKPEPVQVAEAKTPQQPIPAPPMSTSPPSAMPMPPPAPPSSSGGGWWVWLLVGLGVVFIIGGLLFFFLMSGGETEEEEDRPRKKSKKKGRPS